MVFLRDVVFEGRILRPLFKHQYVKVDTHTHITVSELVACAGTDSVFFYFVAASLLVPRWLGRRIIYGPRIQNRDLDRWGEGFTSS